MSKLILIKTRALAKGELKVRVNRHDGFILIALLWVLVALSFIALNLSSSVRAEINVAQAAGEGDRAYFLARGALEEVLFRIVFPYTDEKKQKKLFPYADGMNHFWIEGQGMTCHVAIIDESGKLDLNYADIETVRRLLLELGLDTTKSDSLARQIIEWREPEIPSGVMTGQSVKRERSFSSVEELLQVEGMTRDILYGQPKRESNGKIKFRNGLIDYVTVYSGKSAININYAEPEVLACLPGMDMEIAQTIVEERISEPFQEGAAFSQRIAADIPGEAIPYLTSALSSRFSLVATAWVNNSQSSRSVKLVVKRNPLQKLSLERMIYYDEYWPVASIRKWTRIEPGSLQSPWQQELESAGAEEEL